MPQTSTSIHDRENITFDGVSDVTPFKNQYQSMFAVHIIDASMAMFTDRDPSSIDCVSYKMIATRTTMQSARAHVSRILTNFISSNPKQLCD